MAVSSGRDVTRCLAARGCCVDRDVIVPFRGISFPARTIPCARLCVAAFLRSRRDGPQVAVRRTAREREDGVKPRGKSFECRWRVRVVLRNPIRG